MNVKIDKELKKITPNFNMGVVEIEVEQFECFELNETITQFEDEINKTIDIKDVVNLDIIKDGRDAYKKYGKDPSRYRLSVESLYRRLAKGNKLYRINNIVDIGNLLSILTRKSIAVLDYDKIIGDVFVRLGRNDEQYEGIGRGLLNIENIPVYVDEISAFGSTTSDTKRTSITNKTKKILVFVISFSGTASLNCEIKLIKDFYMKYANGQVINEYIL